MLTNNQIIAAVQEDLRNSSLSSATILRHMDRGLYKLSEKIYLPDLRTAGVVTTHSDAVEGIDLGQTLVRITATGHGLSTGDRVRFASVGGTTELNGNMYPVVYVTADTFDLAGTTPSDFTAWTSGGYFYKPFVSMPTDYHRGLHEPSPAGQIYSAARGAPVKLYSSFSKFQADFGGTFNHGGSVEACCVSGSKLYYQRVPASADTLTLDYYKKPTASAADANAPANMPDRADEFLVEWVKAQVTGNNTEDEQNNKYLMRAMEILDEIAAKLGPADRTLETFNDDAAGIM